MACGFLDWWTLGPLHVLHFSVHVCARTQTHTETLLSPRQGAVFDL